LVAVTLAAACRFDESGTDWRDGAGAIDAREPADARTPDDVTRPDATPQIDGPAADAAIPPADAAISDAGCADGWSPVHFDPCGVVAAAGALDLALSGTYVYDTDDRTLTDPYGTAISHASQLLDQPTGPDATLVSVTSLTVHEGVTLRVVGARPLIVAAFGSINVAGVIDVGSGLRGQGAGGNAACGAHSPTPGTDAAAGGGGGGGGGFGSWGGRGGAGGAGGQGAGGTGGEALAAPPTVVRGGCAGASGGDGDFPETGGAPGASGGAIQLSARDSIHVSGIIHAGGAGAGGGSSDGGGGGAGSGGYIGLDATPVTLAEPAILAANGGGGGGGDDENGGADTGDDATASAVPAAGGSDGTGGNGGAGAAGNDAAGEGGADADGAGGGGGGVGFVLVFGNPPNRIGEPTVSPSAIVVH